MNQKDKDIQELIKQITELDAVRNPVGGDYCPICSADNYNLKIFNNTGGLEYIVHEPNCAYLIAKDLNTNIKHK